MVDILRTAAVIRGSSSSDPYLTQMWWVPDIPGGSTGDATDCLDRFRDMWVILMAKVSSTFTWEPQATCIVIDAADGTLQGAFDGTPGAAVTGTGGSAPLPLQTQGLIRWNTGSVVRGRRVIGRTFVPAPDEADNTTSGQPGGSYTGQLNSGIAALLTAGTTASAPAVWSRPTTGANGSAALITSGQSSGNWAVQRSRR